MAAGRTLTVSLVANTSSFGRGMRSAVRDAQGFQGKMTAVGANLRGVLGPALAAAGAAAAAFATKLAVDGVKAAVADEAAARKLAQTLSNLGEAHRTAGVEDFIYDLQMATGVVDDEMRPAFERLVRSTGDVDEAQRALSIALDISAGRGKSLELVANSLGKAYDGNANALGRMGLGIDSAILKTGNMGVITNELSRLFAGQASQAANTWEGRIKRVGVALDELQESFGTGFLSGLGDSGDSADDLVASIEALAPAFQALGKEIGSAVKALGDISAGLTQMGEDMNVPRNEGLANFGSYLIGITGLIKGLGLAFKGAAGDAKTVAESHADYRDAVVRVRDAVGGATPAVDEFGNEVSETGEDAEQAAEKFDLFAAAIDKTQTVVAFRQAVDEVGKAFKRTNTPVNIFNEKGKENFDLLNDLIVDTAKFAEGQTSLAGKTSAASQGLTTLGDAMANSKMDSATRALLLEPFQALIEDLAEAGVDVGALQDQLDRLRNKTITVTVNTQTYGRPPGVSSAEWYGAENDAMGGRVGRFAMGSHLSDSIPAMLSRGEYVVRASSVQKLGLGFMDAVNMGRVPSGAGGSGVTIGTLNVTSAPGERAEDSVPRSLRRLAFVAGLNV
jgi:hypothetical protein